MISPNRADPKQLHMGDLPVLVRAPGEGGLGRDGPRGPNCLRVARLYSSDRSPDSRGFVHEFRDPLASRP